MSEIKRDIIREVVSANAGIIENRAAEYIIKDLEDRGWVLVDTSLNNSHCEGESDDYKRGHKAGYVLAIQDIPKSEPEKTVSERNYDRNTASWICAAASIIKDNAIAQGEHSFTIYDAIKIVVEDMKEGREDAIAELKK